MWNRRHGIGAVLLVVAVAISIYSVRCIGDKQDASSAEAKGTQQLANTSGDTGVNVPSTLEEARKAVAAFYSSCGPEPLPLQGDKPGLFFVYASEFDRRGWLQLELEQYDEIVRRWPDDYETVIKAVCGKVRILGKLGKYSAGHQALEELLTRYRDSSVIRPGGYPLSTYVTIRVYDGKASLYQKAGDYLKAADAVRQVQELYLNPSDEQSKAYMWSHSEQSRWTGRVDRAYEIAALYQVGGDVARALALYQDILAYIRQNRIPSGYKPVHHARYYQDQVYGIPVAMADCLIDMGKPQAALDKLNQVAKALQLKAVRERMVTPAAGEEEAKSGRLSFHEYDLAVVDYLRKVDLPIRLGKCRMKLGGWGNALRWFKQAEAALADRAFYSNAQTVFKSRPLPMGLQRERIGDKELDKIKKEELPALIKQSARKAKNAPR
ncbi:MAG TPA: hypothetical protein VMX94_02470 [Armatimonadota bacterium]|nr:hypothetical protein [Armatimonadota bacterium]